MSEYRLDPKTFPRLRRRVLLIAIPSALLSGALGLAFANRIIPGDMPWFMWASVIVLALIAGSVGLFIGMQRNMRFWSSLRIILDDEGVTLVRNRGNVRILYSEIRRINLVPGGLAIFTADRFRTISISRTLEHFDDFRQELAQHHAIDELSPAKRARNITFFVAISLLMLAVIVAFFLATNLYVIIAASIGLLLNTIYMVVARRKGVVSNLGPWLFWFSVIFVAVLAIGRMALAILGVHGFYGFSF